jgi:hypothetical protein
MPGQYAFIDAPISTPGIRTLTNHLQFTESLGQTFFSGPVGYKRRRKAGLHDTRGAWAVAILLTLAANLGAATSIPIFTKDVAPIVYSSRRRASRSIAAI